MVNLIIRHIQVSKSSQLSMRRQFFGGFEELNYRAFLSLVRKLQNGTSTYHISQSDNRGPRLCVAIPSNDCCGSESKLCRACRMADVSHTVQLQPPTLTRSDSIPHMLSTQCIFARTTQQVTASSQHCLTNHEILLPHSLDMASQCKSHVYNPHSSMSFHEPVPNHPACCSCSKTLRPKRVLHIHAQLVVPTPQLPSRQ